jgi:potassium/hydrogen antiporter
MENLVILVFTALSFIIFFGYISEIIFKKTKIPDVLILIFLGIILGSVFEIIDKSMFGFAASLFTTFTLIFLLFQGALNIEFKTLFNSLKGTFKLTILGFIFTTFTVAFSVLIFLRFDILTSLLVGTILSGTSSAVIIPIVSNLRANKKYASILTLESAISDVFVIIGSITILALIREGNIDTMIIFKNVLSSFVLSLFIGAIIGLLWIFVLKKSKELIDSYMVTIALLIGLYAFVESPLVSSSGAIAVLSFGLILGNSNHILDFFKRINHNKDEKILERNVLSHSARNFYSEVSFFVKVFFFVYLGILFDFSKPFILFIGLLISIIIYLVRIPVVKLAFYNEKVDEKSQGLLKALVPKGLAAVALAGLALEYNIPRADELVNLVFSVVLISIIITSVLIFLIDKQKSEKGNYKNHQILGEQEHIGIFPSFNKHLNWNNQKNNLKR